MRPLTLLAALAISTAGELKPRRSNPRTPTIPRRRCRAEQLHRRPGEIADRSRRATPTFPR